MGEAWAHRHYRQNKCLLKDGSTLRSRSSGVWHHNLSYGSRSKSSRSSGGGSSSFVVVLAAEGSGVLVLAAEGAAAAAEEEVCSHC